MSEEEIDALFQEAASSFQPPDKKKEIWGLLERRLNKNVWHQHRNIYRITAAVLMFLIVAGIILYFRPERNINGTKKNLTEGILKGQRNMENNQKSDNYNLLSKKRGTVNHWENIYARKGFKNQSSTLNKKPDTKELNNNHNHKVPIVQSMNSITFFSKKKPDYKQLQPISSPGTQYQHLFDNKSHQPVKESIGSLAFSKRTKNDKKKEPESERPYSLQIITGPDWCTVKLRQWRKPTWNIGLLVRYRFASRWTVETGIFNGDKDYNSHSKYFKFSDNTPDRDDINEVSAESHVLTVPLDIIYNLSQNEHHSLSISLGLSSYWFLTEEYTYHYKGSTGLTDKHFELENINKNILSIINISPAYEYYLNKRVSFIAEPYFQLPVSKIGYGSVSMQSAGLNIGAAYHF